MGFGSECYAYKHYHKKLDPRCEKGIFAGYSKNSPAYLVYNPQTEKVSKHRLVKFIKKSSAKQHTQTDEEDSEIEEYQGTKTDSEKHNDVTQSEDHTKDQVLGENKENANTDNTNVLKHDETTDKAILDEES